MVAEIRSRPAQTIFLLPLCCYSLL